MEEEKQTGLTYLERRRQEIISSTASNIELINSARLGTDDYDFDHLQIIREEEEWIVYYIYCKIDGLKYVAKKLLHQNDAIFQPEPVNLQSAVQRDMRYLRALNHPMII